MVPLDDMVSGAIPLPEGNQGQNIVLCCSKGPKSLVALDYLSAALELEGANVHVHAIAGGITAWDLEGLPTEDVQ